MREALRLVKPGEFEDTIALVALYRPGPMGYISTYAARKLAASPVSYADPRLRADHRRDVRDLHLPGAVHGDRRKQLGGFSRPRPRRCARRSGRRSTRSWRPSRTSSPRAARRTRSPRRSASSCGRTWSPRRITPSTKPTLPATRSSPTAAWLKANHPREYMAALISSVMNTKDRVPFYVNACREMGIDVLPPTSTPPSRTSPSSAA